MISSTQSLTQLQSLASDKTPEQTRHVAQEFESLLISELLRAGSKPLFGETPLDGGSAGRMAREQFFGELASHAAASGGLGLAARLEAQMTARLEASSDTETSES